MKQQNQGIFFQNGIRLLLLPLDIIPPHPEARFRPPYGKNVFYGSLIEETALYEHAFYFMKERMHLPTSTETGLRTIFFVDANEAGSIRIHNNCDVHRIHHVAILYNVIMRRY